MTPHIVGLIILGIIAILGGFTFLGVLLYRMDNLSQQYEQYFTDMYYTVKDFKSFLDNLMNMNILVMDDTVFDLVEKTKNFKNQIEEIASNNYFLFNELGLEIESDKEEAKRPRTFFRHAD